MKKALPITVIFFLIFALSAASVTFAQSKGKPVVLRGIHCFPTNDPATIIFMKYAKEIEKASNGMLKIEMKGGPEAIKPRDQIQALSKGVIDIAQSTASNASPVAREALCIYITGKNATENRESGFFDLYDSYLRASGLKFIAHDGDGMTFSIFSRKPVTKLADLKGQILRGKPNYDPFFKALGCSVVTLATSELFNAMQSGIIDGYGMPGAAVPAFGLLDLTKTYIQHQIWNGAAVIVMNLKSYNKLSPSLQKAFTDVAIAQEEATRKYWKDRLTDAEAVMKKAGIQFVQFSPEEAKIYIDLSQKTVWDSFIKDNPVSGPKLKNALK